MKQSDLAKRLAETYQLTQRQASQDLDKVVRQLMEGLRRRGEASLPGLGTLRQVDRKLVFVSEKRKAHS